MTAAHAPHFPSLRDGPFLSARGRGIFEQPSPTQWGGRTRSGRVRRKRLSNSLALTLLPVPSRSRRSRGTGRSTLSFRWRRNLHLSPLPTGRSGSGGMVAAGGASRVITTGSRMRPGRRFCSIAKDSMARPSRRWSAWVLPMTAYAELQVASIQLPARRLQPQGTGGAGLRARSVGDRRHRPQHASWGRGAHQAAKETGLRLIIGARLDFTTRQLLCFPEDRAAYGGCRKC